MELTQARLKELLDYNPETGVFTWKVNRSSNAMPGTVAGSKYSNGYIYISVSRKDYRAHRLAFLYMEGAFPPDQVDHINRVRDDNRWSNLRHADAKLNSNNSAINVPVGKSGYRGVCWHKGMRKWMARIYVKGKSIILGYYDDPAIAADHYQWAHISYHRPFFD